MRWGENARKSRCLYTLLGCAWTMSHDISTHKQLSIAQCHITTMSASFHHHTTTPGDNNNNNDGLDDAFALSGPLGKFFIYFFFELILNLYYRLLQVLPTMHDNARQWCAMSRTTYKDDDDNVLCQQWHTMAACHVNDDEGPDDAFALSGP